VRRLAFFGLENTYVPDFSPSRRTRCNWRFDVRCIADNYDISIQEDRPDCGCGYTDERDNLYAQVAYDYTRENTPRSSGPG
jgi:hypothetical protein